jgi:hypothetical protein
MKRKRIRAVVIAGAIVGLLALLVWASSLRPQLVPNASDEWSRARIVGHTPTSRPPVISRAPDSGILLLWPRPEGDLQLLHVDQDGEFALERSLPLNTKNARDPQMRVGPDGRLHLVWREESTVPSEVWYAVLEPDGTPSAPAMSLSHGQGMMADVPQIVLDRSGTPHALWADPAGIQHVVLSAQGTPMEPILVAPSGRSPAAEVDGSGILHLAWQQQLEGRSAGIYHATYTPGGQRWSEPLELQVHFLRSGQRIEGPEIGLTASEVFVFWTVDDRRTVSSVAHAASFPLEGPREVTVEAVGLARGWNPTDPYPLSRTEGSLLVALSEVAPDVRPGMLLEALLRSQDVSAAVPQIAVTSFPQSGPEEIVTASRQAIVQPALTQDSDGYLHLSALQVAAGDLYRVIYASMAPGVLASYNAVTVYDVVNVALTGVMQLSLFVLTVLPMLFLWAVVPTFGLLAYHWFSGAEELDTVGARVALGIAVALELTLTILVPLRVETTWSPIRWVAPVATAAVAAGITWLIVRAREDNLLFLSYFTYIGIHIALLWLTYLLF